RYRHTTGYPHPATPKQKDPAPSVEASPSERPVGNPGPSDIRAAPPAAAVWPPAAVLHHHRGLENVAVVGGLEPRPMGSQILIKQVVVGHRRIQFRRRFRLPILQGFPPRDRELPLIEKSLLSS